MRQFFFLSPILFLMAISMLSAQSFADHRWKNRLILLFIEDIESNADYVKQLEAFQAVASEMTERKLQVYHITPTKIGTGIGTVETWQTSVEPFYRRRQTEASFELHLIGLDGGLKVTETTFLAPEKLFSIIDAMPMRQAEIRKKE